MWEVVVDGSRISGIAVVEQISLLAKVLWNDLKYIGTCVLKAFWTGFSDILLGICPTDIETCQVMRLQGVSSGWVPRGHTPCAPHHVQAGQLYLRELRGLEASARVTRE